MLRKLVGKTIERLTAAALALIGILVALRFVLGTRYVDALRDLNGQDALDPFMAGAVVLALYLNFVSKQVWDAEMDAESADGPITREYLETNLLFYATVLLMLWVFADWIGGFRNWMLDPLFVIVMGVTSLRLWRDWSSE